MRINHNLFLKLMLSFMSLIVLPLTVVSYVAYSVATQIITNNISRSIQQTVHQLSLNSEMILEDSQKSIYTLFYSTYNTPNIIKEGIESYRKTGSSYEQYQLRHTIEGELNKYAIYHNEVNGMYVISSDSVGTTIFTSANVLLGDADFTSYDWYNSFLTGEADSYWSPSHKVSGYTASSNANVVTFLKKIRSPYDDLLGVVWMDLNERFLENVYTSGNVAPNGYTYILNEDGVVISASDKTIVTQQLEDGKRQLFKLVFAEDNGYYFDQENGVHKLVAFATIHTTGWKMVSVVPASELFVDASRVKNIIVLIALITTAMSTVIALFLSKSISRPIHNLIRLMDKASEGNLTVRAKADVPGEIGKLNKHFNIMIGEIQQLISTVYVTKLKQKEAELASLEAQINPHFLYNTLQSIKWLSDMYKAPDIGDMAISLANIFRFSIKGAAQVSLYDEIQHVRDYIKIQKYRYDDRFEIEYRIPDELLGCQIPKLIVQPLVENAIYHGIETKEDPGLITIWAQADEHSLHIGVEDDGAAVTADKIEEVRRSLKQTAARGAGSIGLKNIHDRLQMLYGSDYGLHVEARPGGGFLVVVSLPNLKA